MRSEQLGLSCLNTEKICTILIETNERLAVVAKNPELIFKARYHFSLATGYCRLLIRKELGKPITRPELAQLLMVLSRETPWLNLETIQRAIATLEGLAENDEERPGSIEIQWTIDLFARLSKAYRSATWHPRTNPKKHKLKTPR